MKPSYDQVVIHHAAMRGSDSNLDLDDIRWFHVHERGWSDIGYSVVVEKVDGHAVAMFARPWTIVPAHARGENSHSIGVCFVGNFEDDVVLVDMDLLRAGADAIASIMHINPEIRRVVRHRDLSPTKCPGKHFPYLKLLELIEARLGRSVETLDGR